MNPDLVTNCADLSCREPRQQTSYMVDHQKPDSVLMEELQTPKVYTSPRIKEIGCLSRLIMGMSGVGIDSLARREF